MGKRIRKKGVKLIDLYNNSLIFKTTTVIIITTTIIVMNKRERGLKPKRNK